MLVSATMSSAAATPILAWRSFLVGRELSESVDSRLAACYRDSGCHSQEEPVVCIWRSW